MSLVFSIYKVKEGGIVPTLDLYSKFLEKSIEWSTVLPYQQLYGLDISILKGRVPYEVRFKHSEERSQFKERAPYVSFYTNVSYVPYELQHNVVEWSSFVRNATYEESRKFFTEVNYVPYELVYVTNESVFKDYSAGSPYYYELATATPEYITWYQEFSSGLKSYAKAVQFFTGVEYASPDYQRGDVSTSSKSNNAATPEVFGYNSYPSESLLFVKKESAGNFTYGQAVSFYINTINLPNEHYFEDINEKGVFKSYGQATQFYINSITIPYENYFEDINEKGVFKSYGQATQFYINTINLPNEHYFEDINEKGVFKSYGKATSFFTSLNLGETWQQTSTKDEARASTSPAAYNPIEVPDYYAAQDGNGWLYESGNFVSYGKATPFYINTVLGSYETKFAYEREVGTFKEYGKATPFYINTVLGSYETKFAYEREAGTFKEYAKAVQFHYNTIYATTVPVPQFNEFSTFKSYQRVVTFLYTTYDVPYSLESPVVSFGTYIGPSKGVLFEVLRYAGSYDVLFKGITGTVSNSGVGRSFTPIWTYAYDAAPYEHTLSYDKAEFVNYGGFIEWFKFKNPAVSLNAIEKQIAATDLSLTASYIPVSEVVNQGAILPDDSDKVAKSIAKSEAHIGTYTLNDYKLSLEYPVIQPLAQGQFKSYNSFTFFLFDTHAGNTDFKPEISTVNTSQYSSTFTSGHYTITYKTNQSVEPSTMTVQSGSSLSSVASYLPVVERQYQSPYNLTYQGTVGDSVRNFDPYHFDLQVKTVVAGNASYPSSYMQQSEGSSQNVFTPPYIWKILSGWSEGPNTLQQIVTESYNLIPTTLVQFLAKSPFRAINGTSRPFDVGVETDHSSSYPKDVYPVIRTTATATAVIFKNQVFGYSLEQALSSTNTISVRSYAPYAEVTSTFDGRYDSDGSINIFSI